MIHDICPKNTPPNFVVQFPALKLRVSGLDPNINYVIMVDIVIRRNRAKINCLCAQCVF